MSNTEILTLIRRFEALIQDLQNLKINTMFYNIVRLKPFFTTYNSCTEEFKSLFPAEYEKLNLEPLPLYDDQGKELFTVSRLSTLLQQSRQIRAVLKGFIPVNSNKIGLPNKVTIHWLAHNVPIKFWFILGGCFITIFILGVRAGQVPWIRSLLPGYSAEVPSSGKPKLELTYRGDIINGKTVNINMEGLNVPGDVALEGVYVKNVGNRIADNLSIKFFIPELYDQSVIQYRSGGITPSPWEVEDAGPDSRYPYLVKWLERFSLSPGENWLIPSFAMILRDTVKTSVSAKLSIFYGAEQPAEAEFIFLLKKNR